MTVLTERNLQITIDDAVDVRKFDDNSIHLLNHCMKAVDFVVEFSDRYLFIEIKDPQAPGAPPEASDDYLELIQTEKIDEELKYKYRDSFLYEWASGRADKPIDYLVLIALNTLTGRILNARSLVLEKKLPVQGPDSTPWRRPFVNSCTVFNIESWNRMLPWPVSRLDP